MEVLSFNVILRIISTAFLIGYAPIPLFSKHLVKTATLYNFVKCLEEWKMAIILASRLASQERNKHNEWVSIPITDCNCILSNMRKYIKKTDVGVLISNARNQYQINDTYTKLRFDSMELSGFNFKERITLDERNKHNAKEIIESADIVFIMGGESARQLDFFEEIRMKYLIKNFIYHGLLISTSAGTMNCCDNVCNYIEQVYYGSKPELYNGLGVLSKIIIPHFNGLTMSNTLKTRRLLPNIDYVLPISCQEYIGLPDGSYYLIDGKSTQVFGDLFSINR